MKEDANSKNKDCEVDDGNILKRSNNNIYSIQKEKIHVRKEENDKNNILSKRQLVNNGWFGGNTINTKTLAGFSNVINPSTESQVTTIYCNILSADFDL